MCVLRYVVCDVFGFSVCLCGGVICDICVCVCISYMA